MEISHETDFSAEFIDDCNLTKRLMGESYERHTFVSDGGKLTFKADHAGFWNVFVRLPGGCRNNLSFSFNR